MSFDAEQYSLALASPWITASNPDWGPLLPFGNIKKYKKGDMIVDIGGKVEKLLYLHRGQVKMVALTKDGTEKTIWYINGPNIFGEVPFFHKQPSKFIILASKNSEVYCFEREYVDNELVHHPAIMKYIFCLLAQKVRVLSSQIEDLIFNNPLARVAKLLYVLAVQNGEQLANDSYVINVRLTHQELANITGLHRVTATNALKKLSDVQIVEKNRENIIIKDMGALKLIIEEAE